MSTSLAASTVTPGRTAPELSLTSPAMVACAHAAAGINVTSAATTTIHVPRRFVIGVFLPGLLTETPALHWAVIRSCYKGVNTYRVVCEWPCWIGRFVVRYRGCDSRRAERPHYARLVQHAGGRALASGGRRVRAGGARFRRSPRTRARRSDDGVRRRLHGGDELGEP